MKTIKIWVVHKEPNDKGEEEVKRVQTDFNFDESIVLGYYVIPFIVNNESAVRLIIVTKVGTFNAPWSIEAESIINGCIFMNNK